MFTSRKQKNKQLPDHELVTRYRYSYDNRYIGELYLRYTHLVFGTCLKYLSNKEDAKDAVMQIFEKILEELKRHDVDYFKGWLYTLTKNYCLMELRKTSSQQVKFEKYVQKVETDVEMDDFLHLEDEERKGVLNENLNKALEKLNGEQKTCVELFYLKQKSYQEVSEITGYSAKQVKSYIQNGKRNLKSHLRKVNG